MMADPHSIVGFGRIVEKKPDGEKRHTLKPTVHKPGLGKASAPERANPRDVTTTSPRKLAKGTLQPATGLNTGSDGVGSLQDAVEGLFLTR